MASAAKKAVKFLIVLAALAFLTFVIHAFKKQLDSSSFQGSGVKPAPDRTVLTYKTRHNQQQSTVGIINDDEAPSKSGYLLPMRIMEQQTTGAKNVLQLGCLAQAMGLKVVEPFARDSFFLYPLSDESVNRNHSISFYYSLKSVKENYHIAKFDTWDEFLNRAPKQIVFLRVLYQTVTYASQAREIPINKCHEVVPDTLQSFTTKNKFVIVRCLVYVFTNEVGPNVKYTEVSDFSSQVFGRYSPSQVTVIIGKWKGLGTRSRIPLNTPCSDLRGRQLMPSKFLIDDSKKYVGRILNNRPYVAIMLRTEKVIRRSAVEGKDDSDYSRELAACYKQVRDGLVKIRNNFKSEAFQMFMTVDLGLFGTKGDPSLNTGRLTSKSSPVYTLTTQFMNEMYGSPNWSLEQWEQGFLGVIGDRNDSGYIAGLQRSVAAQAACLIVVGGGSFQQLAVDLYDNFHSNSNQHNCILRICW